MTDRYVGPGGSDANNGLTWATRKLTLNGVEDSPVAAGDVVYVGPGVYRETLTVDVSGTSGNPITYVGDVTGEFTDGVGGVVRITGSDNDALITRTVGVDATTISYRTFRGFSIDLITYGFYLDTNCQNWVVEDCFFGEMSHSNGSACVRANGATQANITVRRCAAPLLSRTGALAFFYHSAFANSVGNLVENCLAIGGFIIVRTERVGGITVQNCTFHQADSAAVRVYSAIDTGQTVTVRNCILYANANGVYGSVLGDIVEDYNAFRSNATDRNTANTGANSLTNQGAAYNHWLLSDGFRIPQKYPFSLSKWSQVARTTVGTTVSEDMFGVTRPGNGKLSLGAMQSFAVERETTTTRGSSTGSLKLPDAGRVQFRVPTTAVSTTFQVYVYREADYTGTAPQMIIKTPGGSTTVTDGSAAGQWNLLSATLTPSADQDHVVIELISNNTATSGNYDVFFDDLSVS